MQRHFTGKTRSTYYLRISDSQYHPLIQISSSGRVGKRKQNGQSHRYPIWKKPTARFFRTNEEVSAKLNGLETTGLIEMQSDSSTCPASDEYAKIHFFQRMSTKFYGECEFTLDTENQTVGREHGLKNVSPFNKIIPVASEVYCLERFRNLVK